MGTAPPDDASPPGAPPPEPRRRGRREFGVRGLAVQPEIALVALAALVVRGTAWALRPAILPDGADLLGAAEAVRTGGLGEILRAQHHPLPVALAAAAGWFGEPETVVSLAEVVLGALAVWPLHLVVRAACGRHAALVACILYAVLPKFVSVASTPLAEGFFLPSFITALGAACTAGRSRSAGGRTVRLAAAGLLAGCAYLCRPEGLVAGALVPWIAASQARRGRRVGSAVIVLAVFVAVSAPWVAALSSDRGGFALSPKKDLARFAGVAPLRDELPGDASTGMLAGVRGAIGALWDALGPGLLLAVPALLSLRRWSARHWRFTGTLLAGAVVYVLLLVRLRAGWGYAGGRHGLAAATLLLPFAGAGALWIVGFVRRTWARRVAALTLVWLAAIPLAVRAALRPDGEGGERERHLGRAVALAVMGEGGPGDGGTGEGGTGDVVLASFAQPLVAYYADRTLRNDPRGAGRRARNMRLLRDHGRLLAVSADLENRRRDLAEALRGAGAGWLVLDLFAEGRTAGATRMPGRDLAELLQRDGVLGTPAVAAGSELAAFPVR
ncbi:MAG: hypothetical protein HMLKMBBP_00736 [Planctomycetes bacterium]|nr:hypothetical protein [Planctomycetota bacterium]